MGIQTSFHAPAGGADFLGLRTTRGGATEIVYDDGASQRLIWRVQGTGASPERLSDALRLAVSGPRVLPRLFDELKKRSIAVEATGS